MSMNLAPDVFRCGVPESILLKILLNPGDSSPAFWVSWNISRNASHRGVAASKPVPLPAIVGVGRVRRRGRGIGRGRVRKVGAGGEVPLRGRTDGRDPAVEK